ncbi:ribose/xylose/arabinose/galactoside ABC-type transport system permease subunit [Paraburkholderia atlantica]
MMQSTDTPPARSASTVHKWRHLAMQREVIVLLAMVLFNLIFTPHFCSLQPFNVNMTQVVTIVIVGIGMTLVVATGGIDLSVGASMAIAGALAPMLFLNVAGPLGVALAFELPVLAAALCGVFNGLLVTRLSVQPIVATLVLFIAGRGIAQVVTDGSLQAFNTPAFQWIALGKVAGVPFQVLLMLALVGVFVWVDRGPIRTSATSARATCSDCRSRDSSRSSQRSQAGSRCAARASGGTRSRSAAVKRPRG